MKVKKIEIDQEAESAYLYFEDIRPGEAVNQVALPGGMIFDLSADGRILGIEILNAEITKDLSSRKVERQLEQFHIPLKFTG